MWKWKCNSMYSYHVYYREASDHLRVPVNLLPQREPPVLFAYEVCWVTEPIWIQ
jgi:hypothetical protein